MGEEKREREGNLREGLSCQVVDENKRRGSER